MKSPNYTLIAAVARNGVIGNQGRLPWHLPSDLKFFREQTLGKVTVMGRTTFDGIGKPLPGRRIAVLTSRPFPEIAVDDRTWVRCFAHPNDIAAEFGLEPEIMIAGGSQIYAVYLPIANTQLLTEVDCEPEGDSFYPAWSVEQWSLESNLPSPADAPIGYQLKRLRKLE